ncbi:aldehyde dehydrogenase (NADP(+)), partial [Acinetobacter baumannii]
LPLARLQGETGRVTGQLRLFAELLRRGDFYGARIDVALPERKPLPRVDLRQYKVGVGPVAVFGASNFPLAFSSAGGDTVAALAAGCPVVFK